MRLGIDWGGTKLEIIGMDGEGATLLRERVATPKGDYAACIEAVKALVLSAETKTGQAGTVGVGIPGTLSPATGLVKNANSVWINGKPLKRDLETALGRAVRIQNDANCFAVSEAVDGAGDGFRVVAGIILGTGCGSGIAIDGKALHGLNGIAGEFGHTPLPYMRVDEYPGGLCWCGKRGCLETWISGTGFERDYETLIGQPSPLSAMDILALDDPFSRKAYANYVDRLARGLSQLVNMMDPDIIVLGGGMSNVASLCEDVEAAIVPFVFSDVFRTPVRVARHGDSSGVRGAAWLW
ncbi:MAG: ROK family protein [Pseudomonadota bacterium]